MAPELLPGPELGHNFIMINIRLVLISSHNQQNIQKYFNWKFPLSGQTAELLCKKRIMNKTSGLKKAPKVFNKLSLNVHGTEDIRKVVEQSVL